MDQLNLNYIKHLEKTNTHEQIIKNNIIQRSDLCNMCGRVNKVGYGGTFFSGCNLKKFQQWCFSASLVSSG